MRYLVTAIVALFICCVGCEDETTEFCEDACTIWSESACWDFDICIEECEDEGDWDSGYLECLEAAGISCAALEACG